MKWRETSFISWDRKPQLLTEKISPHTHTQLLETYPLTLNTHGWRRCSCAGPRPSRATHVSVPVLFFRPNFCQRVAGHCGRLILALRETMEYCQTGMAAEEAVRERGPIAPRERERRLSSFFTAAAALYYKSQFDQLCSVRV